MQDDYKQVHQCLCHCLHAQEPERARCQRACRNGRCNQAGGQLFPATQRCIIKLSNTGFVFCVRRAPCTACSMHRSIAGASASAAHHSASTAAAAAAGLRCEVLHSVSARLRGALRAEHLEAAVVELARQRTRQVTAQIDMARLRVAALQRQLRWDRVEVLVASRLAPQLCNALSLSKAGQVGSTAVKIHVFRTACVCEISCCSRLMCCWLHVSNCI